MSARIVNLAAYRAERNRAAERRVMMGNHADKLEAQRHTDSERLRWLLDPSRGPDDGPGGFAA